MLDYILNDLKDFRKKDETIGGMVVCDTSEQAKELLSNLKKSTVNRSLIIPWCVKKEQKIWQQYTIESQSYSARCKF